MNFSLKTPLIIISMLCGALYAQPTITPQRAINASNISFVDSKQNIHPILRNGIYTNPEYPQSRTADFLDNTQIFARKATRLFDKFYDAGNIDTWYAPMAPLPKSTNTTIQWIGHATCLVQTNNFNLITDPVLGNLTNAFPRILPTGIAQENLPTIDIVLISHNHRDHLDEKSIMGMLNRQPIFLVPQGTRSWFTSRGFHQVFEFTWWQQQTFTKSSGEQITCTFVPAQHSSGRNGIDTHASLWGGWIITSPQGTIYFAGDTAYNNNMFCAIEKTFPAIDIALMPIGPGSPRHITYKTHMNAHDTLTAVELLHPAIFIPIHWGTFQLGMDIFDEEIKVIFAHMQQSSSSTTHTHILKIGERFALKHSPTI